MITYKIKDEDNKLLSVKENQFESFLVDNNITEYKIQGFNSAALSYDVTVNKVIERKTIKIVLKSEKVKEIKPFIQLQAARRRSLRASDLLTC